MKPEIHSLVKMLLSKVLGFPESELDENKSFFDMGLDSLTAVQLSNHLKTALGEKCPVTSTVAFNYPSIQALTEFIEKEMFPQGQKNCANSYQASHS